MFVSIVSNIVTPGFFAIFQIFDDVVDSNWLNFGEGIRRDVKKINNCIINRKEVYTARKVVGVRIELQYIGLCQKNFLSLSVQTVILLSVSGVMGEKFLLSFFFFNLPKIIFIRLNVFLSFSPLFLPFFEIKLLNLLLILLTMYLKLGSRENWESNQRILQFYINISYF